MQRDEPTENTGNTHPRSDSPPGGHSEQKGVMEVWHTGRLKQAEGLLERFAREFAEREPQDPDLLRDYYRWTGEPHYRTRYGWRDGRPEDTRERPADVIERVNC